MFYRTRCLSNPFCRRIRNFHYYGNKGQSSASMNDTIRLLALENPQFAARFLTISPMQAKLSPIFCSNSQMFTPRALRS